MTCAELARSLYEAYQRRDWDGAGALLHPEATLDMPATGERLVGHDELLGFQRKYPEPWGNLSVMRVVGGDGTAGPAAVEVEIVGPAARFRMAAFWECREGLLERGVEYWVTVGGDLPLPGREQHPWAAPAETTGAPPGERPDREQIR